jgi:hypothetical protein
MISNTISSILFLSTLSPLKLLISTRPWICGSFSPKFHLHRSQIYSVYVQLIQLGRSSQRISIYGAFMGLSIKTAHLTIWHTIIAVCDMQAGLVCKSTVYQIHQPFGLSRKRKTNNTFSRFSE